MTERDLEQLRRGVVESLPEVNDIKDPKLRDAVIEAHAVALAETEFNRIEEIPEPEEGPGATPLTRGTQADHYRSVSRMGLAIADAMEAVLGPLGIDRDVLLAAGLCHDLGKAFEFSPRNQARWASDPTIAGSPAVRHPAYGVHIGLNVGLPEAVIHSIGFHSLNGEGALVESGLENTIIMYSDHAFWQILERARD
jgi:23S rRNA maturation-related 3'-5' exoribonuclease YhaM